MDALQEVYGDDIESLDLLVGNLAEKKIDGFAISETSFFIFIVRTSAHHQVHVLTALCSPRRCGSVFCTCCCH